MVWTKKDYEYFALALHDAPFGSAEERQRWADDFKRAFREDNPNFDATRFESAVYDRKLYKASGRPYGGWSSKTYNTVARIMKQNYLETSGAANKWLHERFNRDFGRDNYAFDPYRFLTASQPTFQSTHAEAYGPSLHRHTPGKSMPVRGYVRRRK